MVCEFSWYLQSEGRVERSAIRGLKGDGGAAVPDRRTDRSRACPVTGSSCSRWPSMSTGLAASECILIGVLLSPDLRFFEEALEREH